MSREIKVGILFVFTIVVFVFGYQYLKGNKIWKKQNNYFAVFENVEGLNIADPVLIKGIPVGKVSNLELINQNSKILATIVLEENIKVPVNSSAILYSVDVLGDKSIRLILGKENQFFTVGDTISTEIEKELLDELGSKITPVTEQINNVIPTLDSTLTSINRLFDKKNENSIPGLVGNLNDMISELKSTTTEIKGIVQNENSDLNKSINNIEEITSVISNNASSIESTLKNLEAISDTLAAANIGKVIDNTNSVMNNFDALLDSINKGKGSLAAIISDPEMYNNLESATGNLDKLLLDIKERPFRYVTISLFGGNKDKSEKKKKKSSKREDAFTEF